MSADRLRHAAMVLRERAEAATPGPWHIAKSGHIDAGEYDTVISRGPVECMAYCYGGSSTIEGDRLDEDRAYIVTMSPPVALALANWLTDLAHWVEYGNTTTGDVGHALAVADAILGGAA